MLRLSHHYILSDTCQSEAFKYTVKSADQAIYRGAFADGLEFVENASKLEATSADLSILVQVIERAIEDLQPTAYSFVRVFSSKKTNSLAVTHGGHVNELERYKTIKQAVESNIQRLIAAGGDRYLPGDGSFLVRGSTVSSPKPPDLAAAWEPSYTAGKTVKLPAAKKGGCVCIVA